MLRQSKGAPAWRAYVEFINNILIQGIALTVTNSLRFLLGMIDPAAIAASDNPSLLMVKLQLANPSPNPDPNPNLNPNPDPNQVKLQLEGTDLFYDPPLDVVKKDAAPGNDNISIMDRVHSWISDFYNVVKLVKRLDRQEGDFLKEMEEHEEVRPRPLVHRPNPNPKPHPQP